MARKLKVRWYALWDSSLTSALASLPEMATCPHGLLHELMLTPAGAEKRTALVTEGGEPVAVIGLVRRERHWQPVGEIPRSAGAAMPGRLYDALAALGVFVRVWNWPQPLPASPAPRDVDVIPAFAVSTRTDFDTLWRDQHNTGHLNGSRNRLAKLGDIELEFDAPGAHEWTIDRWRDKWVHHYGDMTPITTDLKVTAAHLMASDRYHTFRLLHRGVPIAGTNWYADRDSLVLHTTSYDPAYAKYSPGVRLTELVFRWSATSPYALIDLGSGGEYKRRWMPSSGTFTNFSIMPAHLALAYAAARRARGVVQRVRRRGPSAPAGVDSQE